MSANHFFISKERNNVDHYNYYYFDNVFTSENAGFQKPDTGFFQYVFQNNLS